MKLNPKLEPMQATQFSQQNRRSYQEDRSFIKKTSNTEVLLGVFDGHGGDWVSEFAVVHTPFLFRSVRKETKKNVNATLHQIYSRLHENTKDYTCGSTASIVWIKDNVAHVAVLGDSITMIKTESGEIWQSPEHNIRTNQAELHAAILRGGKTDCGGAYLFDKWHIDGPGLQMSRALGDRDLDRVLNREPEIFHISINDDSWILTCSDGLIDPAHADHNAVPRIIELIEQGADAKKLVVEMGIVQNNDNSTAVLVRMS